MNSNLGRAATARSWRSRSYETQCDLQQMQALLMKARAHADDWRYWHVGDLTWEFFILACHLAPQAHIRLWYDGEEKLVGYALLGEHPSVDWQVAPEYAWSGLETEVMAWAETRLADLHKGNEQRWRGAVISGARQDDITRIRFLEQQGFRRGEHVEVTMLRSLDEPIAEPVILAGYQVRAVAATGELSSRAAAQRKVWHPWPVSKVSDDDYARLMRLPGYHRELDVVAVTPDGVIAAYVNGWIDPLNRIGDFSPVGALPAYRQQGLTRAALLEGLRRMQARGMERVCISTGESNTPAIRLYGSIGFRVVSKYLDYEKRA